MLRWTGAARRRAVTMIEMVVAMALVAMIGLTVVVVTTGRGGSAGLGENDHIEKAARTLQDLSEAIALWTNRGSGVPTSFFQKVGTNPGTLSHLSFQITTNDRNSCGRSTPLTNQSRYSAAQVNRWDGSYFRQELPTSGFLVAPGFFALDTMLRYSAVFNPNGPPYFQQQYFSTSDNSTPGTLAIVMPNVKYTDAVALAQRIEGDTMGIWGAVRFTRNLTNAPVTVEYHIGIHGC
jgi:type II secretory pathway pseudopilin PulG